MRPRRSLLERNVPSVAGILAAGLLAVFPLWLPVASSGAIEHILESIRDHPANDALRFALFVGSLSAAAFSVGLYRLMRDTAGGPLVLAGAAFVLVGTLPAVVAYAVQGVALDEIADVYRSVALGERDGADVLETAVAVAVLRQSLSFVTVSVVLSGVGWAFIGSALIVTRGWPTWIGLGWWIVGLAQVFGSGFVQVAVGGLGRVPTVALVGHWVLTAVLLLTSGYILSGSPFRNSSR